MKLRHDGMSNVMFLLRSKSVDYIRPDTVPKQFPYMTVHTFKNSRQP